MDNRISVPFDESAYAPTMVALTVIVGLWGALTCAASLFWTALAHQ
jgi:hypothetical protein